MGTQDAGSIPLLCCCEPRVSAQPARHPDMQRAPAGDAAPGTCDATCWGPPESTQGDLDSYRAEYAQSKSGRTATGRWVSARTVPRLRLGRGATDLTSRSPPSALQPSPRVGARPSPAPSPRGLAPRDTAMTPDRLRRQPRTSAMLVSGLAGLTKEPEQERRPSQTEPFRGVGAATEDSSPVHQTPRKSLSRSSTLTSRTYSEIERRIQEVALRQAMNEAKLSAQRRSREAVDKSPRTSYRHATSEVMTSLGYRKALDPQERSASVVWRKKRYDVDVEAERRYERSSSSISHSHFL